MAASPSLKHLGMPPFVRPMQEAVDRHARQRRTFTPDVLEERVRRLLEEGFGPGVQVATASARGCLGVLAEHTHYSDGFAVLLPLPLGTAVALRPAARARVVFAGESQTWDLGGKGAGRPAWVRLVDEVARAAGTPVEVAVASTIPATCFDAYLAALAVATARAAGPESLDAAALHTPLARCAGMPFSPAYPMAAAQASSQSLLLVDTVAHEALSVEAPSPDVLGWGLVSVEAPPRTLRFHHRRREQALAALARLRASVFPELTTFRDLEHRDLERALTALPEGLRPIARHLVTENRRVPRLVAALRRQDGQLLGALLLMSHASLKDDWNGTSAPQDLAVRTAEELSLEGVHGARMTGRGGGVLVVGRPLAVAEALERIAATIQEQTARSPIRMLL